MGSLTARGHTAAPMNDWKWYAGLSLVGICLVTLYGVMIWLILN
jgi:hypothetical protein